MKIGELFEPGHRKTTMTLIALIGSILLEKYGGGISGDLKEIILAIFAIFTGGNVLSKGIQAAKEIKTQKQVVTDIVTDLVDEVKPQQNTKDDEQDALINSVIEHINKLDTAAGTEIKALKERMDNGEKLLTDISGRLDKQVHNLSEVLKIINGMRNGQPNA